MKTNKWVMQTLSKSGKATVLDVTHKLIGLCMAELDHILVSNMNSRHAICAHGTQTFLTGFENPY